MRLVIQRVTDASVEIDGTMYSAIGTGLLILCGIEDSDTHEDVEWLGQKVCGMRIFNDHDGKMNLDIGAIGGEILVVSQFTLHASTKKGNRPSFIRAARPETATPLYESLVSYLESALGKTVKAGQFGAMMQVKLTNDGPVTIFMDSKNRE